MDDAAGEAARGHPDPSVRIVLRPIASSLPLGFFAFGVGTTLFSALELHWIPASQGQAAAIILLAFVAPLELLPALLAYLARDAGGATTLGLFAMTWTSVGVVMLTLPPGGTSSALGVFLVTVSVFIVALAIASVSGKPIFAATLTLATLRFVLTGLYEASGTAWLAAASGWTGIPLALAAFYTGLGLLLEDTQKHTVLPLFRRGAARMSVESHLGDQVQSIEREAGVRQQL